MSDPTPLRRLVNEQAEDEGLWFVAVTAPEAYVQQELRRLHAAIEDLSTPPSLDVDRLAKAMNKTGHYPEPPNDHIRAWAEAIAHEYARSDE